MFDYGLFKNLHLKEVPEIMPGEVFALEDDSHFSYLCDMAAEGSDLRNVLTIIKNGLSKREPLTMDDVCAIVDAYRQADFLTGKKTENYTPELYGKMAGEYEHYIKSCEGVINILDKALTDVTDDSRAKLEKQKALVTYYEKQLAICREKAGNTVEEAPISEEKPMKRFMFGKKADNRKPTPVTEKAIEAPAPERVQETVLAEPDEPDEMEIPGAAIPVEEDMAEEPAPEPEPVLEKEPAPEMASKPPITEEPAEEKQPDAIDNLLNDARENRTEAVDDIVAKKREQEDFLRRMQSAMAKDKDEPVPMQEEAETDAEPIPEPVIEHAPVVETPVKPEPVRAVEPAYKEPEPAEPVVERVAEVKVAFTFDEVAPCKDIPSFVLMISGDKVYLGRNDNVAGQIYDNSDGSLTEISDADEGLFSLLTTELTESDEDDAYKAIAPSLQKYFRLVSGIYDEHIGHGLTAADYMHFKRYYNAVVDRVLEIEEEDGSIYYQALILADKFISYTKAYDIDDTFDREELAQSIMGSDVGNIVDVYKMIEEYHVIDEKAKKKIEANIHLLEHFPDDEEKPLPELPAVYKDAPVSEEPEQLPPGAAVPVYDTPYNGYGNGYAMPYPQYQPAASPVNVVINNNVGGYQPPTGIPDKK